MNYTSISQSKKLLKLGLSLESADMYWVSFISRGTYPSGKDFEIVEPFELCTKPVKTGYSCKECVPCWSVGALLKVMPRVENNYPIMLRANNFKLTYVDKKGYCIHLETGSLLDVCYNMMIWLLENNYIKKGE